MGQQLCGQLQMDRARRPVRKPGRRRIHGGEAFGKMSAGPTLQTRNRQEGIQTARRVGSVAHLSSVTGRHLPDGRTDAQGTWPGLPAPPHSSQQGALDECHVAAGTNPHKRSICTASLNVSISQSGCQKSPWISLN